MDQSESPTREQIQQQYQSAVSFVQGLLNPVMVDGNYSFGLLTELSALSLNRQATVFQIVKEIRLLERGQESASTTKGAAMFTKPLLAGYWHKHYFAASFIRKNILLEMAKDNTLRKVLGGYFGQILTEAHIGKLVHQLVYDNLRVRGLDSRLTGEWLIFSMAGGRRNYLTLGTHAEGNNNISERIRRHEKLDDESGWDWRISRFTFAS